MAKKLPILTETNPILLWLYRHGWEDPDWGRRPIEQLTIALAVHDLADKITDRVIRKQIQAVTAKAVTKLGQKVVKGSH